MKERLEASWRTRWSATLLDISKQAKMLLSGVREKARDCLKAETNLKCLRIKERRVFGHFQPLLVFIGDLLELKCNANRSTM